jgi:hypothetical protein
MTVVEEFRKCTRPLVTVTMAGALVWFTYAGKIDPKVFETICVFVIGWWFKERSDAWSQDRTAQTKMRLRKPRRKTGNVAT